MCLQTKKWLARWNNGWQEAQWLKAAVIAVFFLLRRNINNVSSDIMKALQKTPANNLGRPAQQLHSFFFFSPHSQRFILRPDKHAVHSRLSANEQTDTAALELVEAEEMEPVKTANRAKRERWVGGETASSKFKMFLNSCSTSTQHVQSINSQFGIKTPFNSNKKIGLSCTYYHQLTISGQNLTLWWMDNLMEEAVSI